MQNCFLSVCIEFLHLILAWIVDCCKLLYELVTNWKGVRCNRYEFTPIHRELLVGLGQFFFFLTVLWF
ncbi:hypothetical protein KC19_2G141900 [Ceratodon purpureus]|uniref:Uncharacterized protein n=1 Tax=Ceratodon purpureus TaxID=3225 RepID=A0A8T0IXL7_CERPU|nr:hypothetical protein KC19_2G141900 [Ceratodon purpureus]